MGIFVMSEDAAPTTEATETAAEVEHQRPNELPADHPLVKTLAVQKAEIKDLKSKAARLSEIEEAQKSDAEKFADRIAKAEAEVASVPARVSESLKSHLVALHQISEEDAELFLTAAEPETLLKQVARLVGQTKRKSNMVPSEGSTPSAASSDEAAFARELFSGN